ncbi:MAG: dihydroxy-acid dehydratase [Pseudomonadota bacterium]
MMGRDTNKDVNRYGPWPWLFGVVIAVFLMWVMFHFAMSIGG